MKTHPLVPFVTFDRFRRTRADEHVRATRGLRRLIRAAVRQVAHAVSIALLLVFSSTTLAEVLTIGGSGAALGTMRLLANEFNVRNPDISITMVPALGSRGGVKAMIAGRIGIAVTSRAISEGERKLGIVEIEYARTPFVFAISAASTVTAMTSQELADIYAGKMTAWADGSPVRVVLRPISDVNNEMIKSISGDLRLGLLAAYARPGVRVAVSDQDAAGDLERIAGSIGPSTLALIFSENRALRALKFNGVEPTPANAESGAYPYYVRLFLVTGAKRPAAVDRFIAFVQSPAGQRILLRTGHWVS